MYIGADLARARRPVKYYRPFAETNQEKRMLLLLAISFGVRFLILFCVCCPRFVLSSLCFLILWFVCFTKLRSEKRMRE